MTSTTERPAIGATRLAPGVNAENLPTHIRIRLSSATEALTGPDDIVIELSNSDPELYATWKLSENGQDYLSWGAEPDHSEHKLDGDDADTFFDLLVDALNLAGGMASWLYLESGDVYVLAYEQSGIVIDYTYADEGDVRLDELPFVSEWEWFRG